MRQVDKDGRLISFGNYCTCGGYAWQMNGRPEEQPHMDWCPQREEYADWFEDEKRRRAVAGQTVGTTK